jgi:hypothetical protein
VCGRYSSFLPAEAMAQIFGMVNLAPSVVMSKDSAVVPW